MTILKRHPAARLSPMGSLAPPVKVWWMPLHTGSGTTTGATTEGGFANRLGVTGTTRGDPATLTVTAGTVAWQTLGGLTFTAGSNASLRHDPGVGDELTFLTTLLDLAAYEVGMTLMVGCELVTPEGWKDDLIATTCLASFGDFAGAGGGAAFILASNERPALAYRAVGASAAATSVTALAGIVTESEMREGRNTIVYELQCTAENQFIARAHLFAEGQSAYTGGWSTTVNMADPTNGGTAAPGPVDGSGIRLGARKSGATNDLRLQFGVTLRNVWFAQFPVPPRNSIGLSCCTDMMRLRGVLPRTLRQYNDEDVDSESAPDGNYDLAMPPVTLGDMFIGIDGKREIGAMPSFTIVSETSTTKGSNKSTNIHLINPKWVSGPDFEGVERAAAVPGGNKWGRTQLTPASADYPAFLFSAYPTDTSNRARAEVAWRGPAVTVPYGEEMWIGMRLWYDHDMGAAPQHGTIMQIIHGAPGSLLNPPFGVNLYQDYVHLALRHSAVENMVKADQTNLNFYTATPPRGSWFDIIIKCRLHWDETANPYTKIWIAGTLVLDYVGPCGYKGPAWADGNPKPIKPEIRFGLYPGVPTPWTPDLIREVYIRRAFACKNVGNYTVEQISAALAA